jgi:hypothetical protein
MRYIRWFSYVLLFVISTLSGFNSGKSLKIGWDSSSLFEQRNILIINTENIQQANSRLKSVWLLIFYTDSPRVDLLPIFPVTGQASDVSNQSLAGSFGLSANGEPSPAFWDQMKTLKTWWDGYILLDDTVTASLMAFLDGGNAISIESSSKELNEIPLWFEDPQTALAKQTEIYQVHCQRFTTRADFQDILPLILALYQHAHTNLDPAQLIGAWRLLHSYSNSLNCAFPTLTAAVR